MRQDMLNQQSFAEQDVRSKFIMKTYLHLFVAVMAFVVLEGILLSSETAIRMAGSVLQSGWWLILIAFMVVSWAATYMARAQSKPVQYAGLSLYVVAEAAIFLPLMLLALHYSQDGRLIFKAGMVTLSGFIGLTGIAFVTRKNFSFLRGFIMWGGILALVAIFGGMLMGFNLGLWFSVAMVGLAGASILYTTSNIIHEYSEDDYVGASLELFASLALMLWYVLQIFINLSGDD